MKLKIIFFALLLIQAVNSQPKFKIEFDYARFWHTDSLGYLEIYYSFYEPQFKEIINENSEMQVSGSLHLLINNTVSGDTVVNKDYQFSSIVEASDTNRNRGFTGVLNYILPAGNYTGLMKGRDINNQESLDSIRFDFEINIPPADRFSVSDIELSSNIKESESQTSMFYKNTYEVIPNPAGLYGDKMPVLYFYSEIYNINIDSAAENLKVENILYNSANQVHYKKSKMIPRKNTSVVEVGAINISKAPSGAYTLVVAASDTVKNLTVYSSKRLYIFNPGVVDTLAGKEPGNMLSSEFSMMSEEELDETFGFSWYIATDKEQDQWAKLSTEDAKRKFLFDFWKSKDKNTSTPENEYKRDYFDRVKTANEKYTTIQRKGWRTDRGRVLIMYGEPTDIERYPNQVDTKPYEIWGYNNLEGGVYFVFVDITGFNDYSLVHSTMRGELRDDAWARKAATY